MVAQKAAQLLGDKLNTVVSVDKIDISFFKFLSLEKVYIEDLNSDTLFYIEDFSVEIDYWSFKNDSLTLNLGVVQVTNPVYNLHQAQGDSLTNITNLFSPLSSSDTTSSNFNIKINSSQVSITDGIFNWNNENFKHEEYGINWDHLGLSNITGDITDFEMINDSFNANINHLSGKEISGFIVDNFSGKAIFSSTLTQVDHLKINTPYSDIKADLKYEYDSISSYTEFVDQVYMRYQFDTSVVNFKDIAYFSSTLEGLDYEMTVFGKERGPIRDMKFQDIYIGYGESTVLNGRIFITGLPNIESTSFACKLKKLSTNQKDLTTIKKYPFTEGTTIPIPSFLKNAGDINFKGDFIGVYNNFVTYGTFESDNGKVTTDLKLAEQTSGNILYDGKIATKNFDLAELTNNSKLFGKASIDIDVKGENLNFNDVSLKMEGTASAFDFMGYTYKDVKVDAEILDKVILGTLDIIDTNVNLSFDGQIDLSTDIPQYQFTSTVDHLRPKQLNLMKRDSSASLTTKVDFNFKGNSIDNVIGTATLSKFHFQENQQNVDINNIEFTAFTQGKDKTMNLKSENIDLSIVGEFSFREIIQSLNYIVYKWLPSVYEAEPKKPSTIENFTFDLKASKFSGFSSIFVPQVVFKNDLNIFLSYNSETEEIDLKSTSSEINIGGQDIKNLDLKALLTVDTFLLASTAKAVLFSDSNYIENVDFSATAYEDLIKSNIKWNNDSTLGDDSGELHFDINFLDPNNFKIKSYDSWIVLNDTLWNLHNQSQITKNYKEYLFENVMLSQNNQDLKISGYISEDPLKKLHIEIDSLNLNLLNPLLNKYNIHTDGIVDGKTSLLDFYNEFQLHSKINFESLIFNHQKIGNGLVKSIWDSEKEKFDLDINFKDETLEKLSLSGAYYPKRDSNKLDLNLELDHFPAKIIEPFAIEVIDNVEGYVSGSATIKGTIKKPLFDGRFKLHEIETRIIYLNETLYTNNQEVFITPTLIGADVIEIRDSKGELALVNFSLFHDNFEKVNYDVYISSETVFRAFNTTKSDNKYFYGEIYLNPESSIGIESDYQGNISLNAVVNSGPETFVTIPFYDDDEVAQRDYIYFKETETNIVEEKDLQEEESFGINLDMDLNLNKNAEVQLIFDEFTNDKIQATGNGNITLKINKNDDFNIYGIYEIIEGFYLFTFSKVISKKFQIKEGGKLTWNGDPYAGKADLDASYKVRTTIVDLNIGLIEAADSNKRIPVEVVLNMTGNYMNPDLNFSFILPPKYEEIQTLLNTLDAGEKNKQVFALLILNKFLPITGDVTSGSSTAIASNTSEVLSNQLSNILSNINKDFDVGVRYSPGTSASSADEVELALSTQLFNDRVLLETNVGMTGSTTSNNVTSSGTFIGEFTVSYKINSKGNIVGKVFNRSNEFNPVTYNTAPYTQGIGIAYSEPFKSSKNLGCIMSNHFKKTEKKRDCEEEYYQQQVADKDKNQAKILKSVAKSRIKQQEKNRKKAQHEAKKKARKEDQ